MCKSMLKVFCISLVLFSSLSNACQPEFDDRSLSARLKSSFEKSEIIAFVYVNKVETSDEGELNTHFTVLESFKGNVQSFETGWVAYCCLCHMHFMQNQAYLVHAEPREGHYFINAHDLSKELKYVSPKELKYLRKYSKKHITSSGTRTQ